MKLLLTSSGISNTSIHNALVDLLGKSIAESNALFIPTAIYPFPFGARFAWQPIGGKNQSSLCQLGWKSLGLLELTALPSIEKEVWIQAIEDTDALLVWGGDPLYLSYWLQQSGLADLLPLLLQKMVYVGLSAGSMIMTSFGTTYGNHTLPAESDKSLGLLDFALHPHLDYELFPGNSLANPEKLAATIPVPSYAIDDQTAIKVTDGAVEVISEGHWKLFTPIDDREKI